ncbi:MAG: UbiD family decarboxylase, partial [Neisseriaceae bacterium]|nr:UbiD family decarboxylase [Neisseriaceae bacterium]
MKKYADLREFIQFLEEQGELKRIHHPVSPYLEITEIADRVLRTQGAALLFDNPIRQNGEKYRFPVLANLFGTARRVALGMGADNTAKLREIGLTLANLKEPEPPKGLKDTLSKASMLKALWDMS